MSLPLSRIRPSSGVSKPASIRSSVVLPQPLGPSSAKNSPARMSSDSRSTARKVPNFFATPSMRNSGMSACGAGPAGSAATSIFGGSIFGNSSVMLPVSPVGLHASGGSASAQPCSMAHGDNVVGRASTEGWFHGAIRLVSRLAGQGKMNRDRYGQSLTTASDSAAAFYRDGVDLLLMAWYGASDAFDKAIAEDPTFALAHAARARIHQINMEGADARAKAALARQLAATASRRER